MWTHDCSVAASVNSALCLLTLLVGWILMRVASRWQAWYDSLRKAPWTPPSWAFAVAWVINYSLLAAAGVLATYYYEQPDSDASSTTNVTVRVAYYLQFPLHLAWIGLFFVLRSPVSGLVILLLTSGIAVSLGVFVWSVHAIPGALITPYVVWIVFATSLNIYVVLYNPSTDDTPSYKRPSEVLVRTLNRRNVA
jgi:tryptophan-rich sensory protein